MGRTRLLEERLKMIDHLRIVWAIVAKDVIDGLKSRTIWRYIIIVLLIMVGYRYLPEIGRAGEVEIVIYDKGSSCMKFGQYHPWTSLRRSWMMATKVNSAW
jgi:hypothetical protein